MSRIDGLVPPADIDPPALRRATLGSCIGLALLSIVGGCRDTADAKVAFEQGDYPRAVALWRSRADAGEPEAQNYLGVHYQLGLGVPRDPARAVAWYRRAALAGNSDAQRNLGTLYYRGVGIEQDKVQAYGWYQMAASGGNRVAEAFMAAMNDEVTPNQMNQARQLIREQFQRAKSAADIGSSRSTPLRAH